LGERIPLITSKKKARDRGVGGHPERWNHFAQKEGGKGKNQAANQKGEKKQGNPDA